VQCRAGRTGRLVRRLSVPAARTRRHPQSPRHSPGRFCSHALAATIKFWLPRFTPPSASGVRMKHRRLNPRPSSFSRAQEARQGVPEGQHGPHRGRH
jgi:hypothetical protein